MEETDFWEEPEEGLMEEDALYAWKRMDELADGLSVSELSDWFSERLLDRLGADAMATFVTGEIDEDEELREAVREHLGGDAE